MLPIIKRVSLYLLAIILIMEAHPTMAQKKTDYKYKRAAKSNPVQPLQNAKSLIKTDPIQAIDLLSSYLKRNYKVSTEKEESEIYQMIGQAYFQLKQYDLALENYLKALGTGNSKIGFKLRSKTAFSPSSSLNKDIGDVYLAMEQWDDAITYFQKYLTAYLSPSENRSDGLLGLAEAHLGKGELDEALKYGNEAGDISKSFQNVDLQIRNNQLIGTAQEKKGNNEPALESFKKALELAEKERDNANSKVAVEAIGRVLHKQNNFEKELGFKKEVLDKSIEQNDLVWQNSLNLDIAELYLNNEQADEAIPFLNKSVALAEEIGDIEQNIKARKSLSDVYATQGNYDAALSNYENYVALVDEHYENKQKEIQLSNEVMQDLYRKQETINLMEKDMALNESEIQLLEKDRVLKEESLTRQSILIYGLFGFITVILISGYLLYRNVNQKKIANQLLALKSLRSQMNPHFIFNALNSVNSFISKNDTRQANKYLSEFSKLMRTVMENSQTDFVPLSEEIETLALYLKLEHFRFQDKFKYEFRVDPGISSDEFRIPPMLIQPYIENAIWHGLRYKEEKGFLSVSIQENTNALLMTIEDNGIGRKKSKALKTVNQKNQQSTGMKNTENRIKLINDTYKGAIHLTIEDLDKNKKTGTRVTVSIPKKLIE